MPIANRQSQIENGLARERQMIQKMFRVVKDRERWFGVVMGDASATGERETEQQANRVPLPPSLAAELTMNLSLPTLEE